MNIWNKVLVGVIAVFGLVFFYMAARTLKTHQHWGDAANKLEARIEQVRNDNERLRQTIDGELRLELERLLADRSRAWFNCGANVKVNPADGTAAVVVAINQPAAVGIAVGAVLYAFEESAAGQKGRYLGQFKAAAVQAQQVQLEPVSRLSPREAESLASAKGPWALYEVMPRDSHDAFAAIDDKQVEAMLPAETAAEYVGEKKTARPLRDYQVLLSAAQLRFTLLIDRISAWLGDNRLVDEALTKAKEQEKALQAELALAAEDVKQSAAERDAVVAYRKSLEKELEAVKAAIAQLIKSNQAMAGQLAKRQFEAARRIDERTRAMAQSGTESF